ncbi:hypothetical protein [Roseibium sp.]|uniref:hypothetical protein n=1 Tax=Roseibium sp. TaxID=1936156 RepID=UPI0032976BDE
MSELETFRSSVEVFIKAHDWTPTRFGREAAGDPLFVFQLRKGREPRSATRERVLSFIAASKGEGAAA